MIPFVHSSHVLFAFNKNKAKIKINETKYKFIKKNKETEVETVAAAIACSLAVNRKMNIVQCVCLLRKSGKSLATVLKQQRINKF